MVLKLAVELGDLKNQRCQAIRRLLQFDISFQLQRHSRNHTLLFEYEFEFYLHLQQSPESDGEGLGHLCFDGPFEQNESPLQCRDSWFDYPDYFVQIRSEQLENTMEFPPGAQLFVAGIEPDFVQGPQGHQIEVFVEAVAEFESGLFQDYPEECHHFSRRQWPSCSWTVGRLQGQSV